MDRLLISALLQISFLGCIVLVPISQNDRKSEIRSNVKPLQQMLRKGSYLCPKILENGALVVAGDIFKDLKTNHYFRALKSGTIQPKDNRFSRDSWQNVSIKAEWMTLIRDQIAEIRLGDLILPGSHDSGSYGITENHTLVDRNELFTIAPSDSLANWSRTQDEDLKHQLESGYRYFDLRIASIEDGSFYWWHAITGHEIHQGLDQISAFAVQHPTELVLLHFNKFRSPGNNVSNTLPMPDSRKDELVEIFRKKIMARVVDRRVVPDNPKPNQVWSTGKNLLVYCDDEYIREKIPEFWPDIINHLWASRSNPEELFVERSEKLRYYLENFANSISYIGAAVTTDDKIIIGYILKHAAHNETLRELVNEIFPEIANLTAEEMSFEGLHYSLVDAAHNANKVGMDARPLENYTTVASVHFKSINQQINYWLARRKLYKPNIIGLDSTSSSSVVEHAIRANSEPIPAEVAISFQGNTRDGFLEWDLYKAVGGRDGYSCNTGQLSYEIGSQSNQFFGQKKEIILNKTSLTIQEAQYPSDTVVVLSVSSQGSGWYELYRQNIQTMIDNNEDLYVRVVDLGSGTGIAYISKIYNHFGEDCSTPPTDDVVNIVRW